MTNFITSSMTRPEPRDPSLPQVVDPFNTLVSSVASTVFSSGTQTPAERSTDNNQYSDRTQRSPEYVWDRLIPNESNPCFAYTGEWENGQPNGKGCRFTTEPSFLEILEGNFVDGTIQGYGKKTMVEGSTIEYEGNFVNGVEHGQGKLIYPDGIICEGEFVNGAPCGKGKITYPNGAVYEGEFANGTLCGKGKITYPNGEVYEGDFANNQCHGKGIYTELDGAVFDGEFCNNKRHGKVTCHVPTFVMGSMTRKCQFNMGRMVDNPDQSQIGEILFLALLFGYSPRPLNNYALSILSDHLCRYFQNDPTILSTIITPLVEASRLSAMDRSSDEELSQLLEKIKQGQPCLMELECTDHAIGLNLIPSQDGQWIECEIFNSGSGLRDFHNYDPVTRKYQTMKKVRIPSDQLTLDKMRQLINSSDLPNIYEAYAALGMNPHMPNPNECVINNPIWQRRQKKGNCTIEWIFAYLKNKLPPEVYKKMRRDLFCASLQMALSRPDLNVDILSLPRIQRKMRKLNIDPERDLGVLAQVSPPIKGLDVFKDAKGTIFEGEHIDDLLNGVGVIRHSGGMVYEGECVDNAPHGMGVAKYSDGGVYEGEFSDSKGHGKGVLRYPDGWIYEGDFANGKMHGNGILKDIDQGIYVGEFVYGKMHGKGVLKYPGGWVYEGDFVNGIPQGPLTQVLDSPRDPF